DATRVYDLTRRGDGSDLRASWRLTGQNAARWVGRGSQYGLEIPTVGQRVVQRGDAIGELLCELFGRRCDWDVGQSQHRGHAALRRQPRQVQCQAVAQVHARVQLVTLVQQQGLGDARLEIQVMAEDAAAQRAGDENPIADF